MKIIAYFLPQFHEIPENNKWWGVGFTEWTNIKQAKALYNGHEQPIIPLNKNYYNLLDKNTMLWQAKLQKKYKIEGLCYYHYWFNGKKILEKPLENLLIWKDIPQKFCFCWANHSWRKTWDGTMEILIKQTYNGEEEWKNHIEYLIPFFKDKRYLKVDKKPIFMIYDADSIPNLEKRLEYYNKKVKEVGIESIYFIKSLSKLSHISEQDKFFQGITLREPNIGISSLNFFYKLEYRLKRRITIKYLKKPAIFEDKTIYYQSLKCFKEYKNNCSVIPGSFNKWDSTPRHGKRGYVIENKNLKNFKEYLLEQKKIMKEKNIEYIFFNAWNEWAEGMYLEPDEKNGYKYLEIIKEVIETEV